MRPSQTVTLILGLVGAINASASPYATEIVRATGSFGAGTYGDTNAVLGAPATWFYDPFGVLLGGTSDRRVKLVEAPFSTSPTNSGVAASNLLLTFNAGCEVIVRFEQPIHDDPTHPYGIDLLVFGNSFFTPNQFVNESTDMGTCLLSGTIFSEPLKVSVSPGFTGQPGEVADDPDTWPWYRFDDGPFADGPFPTQAFKWNRATTDWSDEMMDFTKPVNPAMKSAIQAGGLSAADAIDLYAGSGGGTGFDLRESGFAWIQYVKVEGIDPDFSIGEVDAFAAVRSMVLGDVLTVTPENILSNTAALFFQKPDAPDENAAMLTFTEVSDIAIVSTKPLNELSSFAPLSGIPLATVELEIAPVLGQTAITFVADLAMNVGTGYSGAGDDLLVFQADGTNWTALPFSYKAANRQVLVPGVTNLSAFAVIQLAAPALQLETNGANYEISFMPLPGFVHTLERSTNLIHWTEIDSITANSPEPVVIMDTTAPAERAFYRLKLSQP